MVARTLPLPRPPHPIPSEILKSCDRHHTRFRGILTPGVVLAIVDAFAKFKERGFILQTIA